MTTLPHRLVRRGTLALGVVAVTLLAFPAAATAHAELDTSDPADGAVVEGTPDVIQADFTDTLADGSRLRLRDAGGTLLAEGTIDPANDRRMVIEPPELAPGTYEVVWQAIAEDRHLERGRYSFTVEAAAPTPEPTPVPTPLPTAAGSSTATPETATPTVAPPTSSPAATPDEEPASGTSDILLPILVVMAIVVVGGALLLGRRRASP